MNPTERPVRVDNPIDELSAINNNEFKMHAEIDAMSQAKNAGLKGGTGTLTVTGKNVCPYCTQLDMTDFCVRDGNDSR